MQRRINRRQVLASTGTSIAGVALSGNSSATPPQQKAETNQKVPDNTIINNTDRPVVVHLRIREVRDDPENIPRNVETQDLQLGRTVLSENYNLKSKPRGPVDEATVTESGALISQDLDLDESGVFLVQVETSGGGGEKLSDHIVLGIPESGIHDTQSIEVSLLEDRIDVTVSWS